MHKYRARYQWSLNEKNWVATYKDFEAPNPVSAINQFHRFMQLSKELKDRKILLRPELKPSQYKLISLHHVYHNAAFHANPIAEPLVESEVDLPRSPNPELPKKELVGAPFDEELGV